METINKLKELMRLCIDKEMNMIICVKIKQVSVDRLGFYGSAYYDNSEPLTHSVDGLIQKVKDFKIPSEDEIKQAKIEALLKELNELTK